MSMGYGANYADTISDETLEALCGEDYTNFKREFEKYENIDVNNFFSQEEYKEFISKTDHDDQKLAELYAKLIDAFSKNTGLEISLCYHDEDDGDAYDEVSGFFWSVDGVYQMTEAGKKFSDVIERKFYVTFG